MAPQSAPFNVEFDHVSKRFGDFVAVRDLNVKIRQGEFFSLLGPSGCGKTTTLRMVAGFEKPTGGEVYLDANPVSALPPNRRNVNTVFQNYALFPHLSIRENVAFGPRRRGVGKAEMVTRVEQALEMVEMSTMASRKPDQLSGGQQQRVALARALVNLPTVLLLDEPLGALDARLRKSMQVELKRLQREVGITFIYVTHDQEEALTMSDRIAVMRDGIIEQVGTPLDIYENPKSAFVANFIGTSNIYTATVTGVSPDAITCKTALGLSISLAANAQEVRIGQATGVMVRPEKIVICEPRRSPEPSSDSNYYEGVIRESVYLGSTTQLIVELEGKHLTQVIQQNHGHGMQLSQQQGRQVRLFFPPGSCSLIPAREDNLAAEVPLSPEGPPQSH